MEEAGSGPGARFRLRELTKRDSSRDDAEQKKLTGEAKLMAQVTHTRTHTHTHAYLTHYTLHTAKAKLMAQVAHLTHTHLTERCSSVIG